MQRALTLEIGRPRVKVSGCRVYLLDALRIVTDDAGDGIHDGFRHTGMKA
jgi:hypothetical protein